jgi:hypothetical protein
MYYSYCYCSRRRHATIVEYVTIYFQSDALGHGQILSIVYHRAARIRINAEANVPYQATNVIFCISSQEMYLSTGEVSRDRSRCHHSKRVYGLLRTLSTKSDLLDPIQSRNGNQETLTPIHSSVFSHLFATISPPLPFSMTNGFSEHLLDISVHFVSSPHL